MCGLVSKTGLFSGLDPAECEQIVSAGRQTSLVEGETLFHQGDQADVFYIVLSGYVKLTELNPEGHQITVSYVGSGGGIGIIVALSDTNYPVTAEVITGGVAIIWTKKIFRELMLQYPLLSLNGMKMIANYFVHLQNRFHELAAERVERRVARALLRLVRHAGRKIEQGILIDFPLSRQDLAEITGTTLFTVSRILKRWEQQGIVLSERERVTICQPHQLMLIAEDLPQDKEVSPKVNSL